MKRRSVAAAPNGATVTAMASGATTTAIDAEAGWLIVAAHPGAAALPICCHMLGGLKARWLGDLDSNQGCPGQSREFYR